MVVVTGGTLDLAHTGECVYSYYNNGGSVVALLLCTVIKCTLHSQLLQDHLTAHQQSQN